MARSIESARSARKVAGRVPERVIHADGEEDPVPEGESRVDEREAVEIILPSARGIVEGEIDGLAGRDVAGDGERRPRTELGLDQR